MYNTILLTGCSGFVGSNIQDTLEKHCDELWLCNSANCDLRDPVATKALFNLVKPDCVIHLAALCGGIGANKDNPGKFIRTNLQIGLNVVSAAMEVGTVKKFINTGTICAYPKYAPIPFKEEDLWNGYPEETNAPYGIAKKTITELLIACNKQYGFNSVNLYPTNMYGPYDGFDPKSSHVIPAIILKVYNAVAKGEDKILLWGTGSATRDFLYVEDFCHAVGLAIKNDPGPEPINIGTNQEWSIKETTEMICDLMKFDGKLVWDSSLPDGQPRRCVNSDRAKELLDYIPITTLERGLNKTIAWFLQEQQKDNQ